MLPYLTLLSMSFLAATIFPFGSEPILVAVVVSEKQLLLPVLVASCGNIAGSMTTFWLGLRSGQWAEKRHPRAQKRLEQARHIIQRWGTPSLFLAWVPLLGDLLVMGAGVLRLPVWRSFFWMSCGKLFRYAVIAWGTLALLQK